MNILIKEQGTKKTYSDVVKIKYYGEIKEEIDGKTYTTRRETLVLLFKNRDAEVIPFGNIDFIAIEE